MLSKLKNEKNLALICTVLVVLIYHLIFFNRFFPIQEGWFSTFAHKILSGYFPYKDFYLFVQPLFTLKITLLTYLFGDNFIVFRIEGLIERLILTALIFLTYSRIFSIKSTILVTLTTIAVYASNSTDVIYSYYQMCLLFAITSVYFAIIFILNSQNSKKHIWIYLSGIFAALSFLTKQSTGLLISLTVLVIVFICIMKTDIKKAVVSCFFYIFGYFLPICIVFSWIYYNKAFVNYINQVYISGASSKGSILQVLFGFWSSVFSPDYFIVFLIIFIPILLFRYFCLKHSTEVVVSIFQNNKIIKLSFFIFLFYFIAQILFIATNINSITIPIEAILVSGVFLILWILLFIKNRINEENKLFGIVNQVEAFLKKNKITFILIIAGCCLAAFLIPLSNILFFAKLYQALSIYYLKLLLVYCCFYLLIIFIIIYFIKIIKGKGNTYNSIIFLLSAISFAIMYSHGMSFNIEEHSIVPALGLFIGLVINYKTESFNRLKNSIIYFACLAIIVSCAAQRYEWPYKWWGWTETPICNTTELSNIDSLEGFHLSHITNSTLTDICEIIKKNSSINDNIYTFPNIPIFYVLTNRYPNTFALVHYFDVCPDKIAEDDAKRLLSNPPKVIVNFDFSEGIWKFHEKAFRNGKQSGQRKIDSAIKKLIKTQNYKLKKQIHPVGVFNDDFIIKVWVK